MHIRCLRDQPISRGGITGLETRYCITESRFIHRFISDRSFSDYDEMTIFCCIGIRDSIENQMQKRKRMIIFLRERERVVEH